MTEITLNLQYPLTVAHAADHAELCVEGAKQAADVDLDYSEESLEYLSAVIDGWRSEQQVPLQEIASVLLTFGCYVGEVFVRNAGAKWLQAPEGTDTAFPLLLELQGGTVCRPIDKVFQFFEDGDEEDLTSFYQTYTSSDSSAEKELVPVLRNIAPGDYLHETAINRKIADDLGVFACRKIITAEGSIGIDFIMKAEAQESGADEAQLIDYCYENFFSGNIEVNTYEQEGDEMLEFAHEEGLITAMIGHPESYERVAEMLNARDIAIVVVNPDLILATRKGSAFEPALHKIVEESESENDAIKLEPAVYYWSEGKLIRATV